MAVTTDLLGAVNGPTSGAKGASANDNTPEGIQKRFLTLLIAQLNNQDPTNPLENAELTSQLAQLSTVSGIEQLNSSLGSLMNELKTAQSLQSANMIGHSVLTPGNKVTLVSETVTKDVTDEDGNVTQVTETNKQGVLGVNLDRDVDSLKVTIRDAKGNEVQTVDLGKQKAGVLPVLWDGSRADGTQAADGPYTFEIVATAGGQSVQTTSLSFGMVSSVSAGKDGVKLNVAGVGPINVSDVVQIL